MTFEDFKAQMLTCALGSAKALCQITADSMTETGTPLESEQVRKNLATILVTLTETEEFLKGFNQNNCSNSD